MAQASADADGATDGGLGRGRRTAASDGAADGDAPALLQAATAIAMRPVARMAGRAHGDHLWVLIGNGRECTGERDPMSYWTR